MCCVSYKCIHVCISKSGSSYIHTCVHPMIISREYLSTLFFPTFHVCESIRDCESYKLFIFTFKCDSRSLKHLKYINISNSVVVVCVFFFWLEIRLFFNITCIYVYFKATTTFICNFFSLQKSQMSHIVQFSFLFERGYKYFFKL